MHPAPFIRPPGLSVLSFETLNPGPPKFRIAIIRLSKTFNKNLCHPVDKRKTRMLLDIITILA